MTVLAAELSQASAATDAAHAAHLARLRDLVTTGGGIELPHAGGPLLVVFSSCLRAVNCAVAMQQATDRRSRTGTAPLGLRIGISTGEVVLEDGEADGSPVVEATRLVAAARPAQVLANAVVRVLVGVRAPATFFDLGTWELEGLPDPVAVCELTWERVEDEAAPVPTLVVRASSVFVGREAELARLQQMWKEACASNPQLAIVSGEPGVGKTRLAAELAAAVAAQGGLVLAGRCDEDMGMPFQPFVDALRFFVDHCPPERRRALLGRHAGDLRRLLPELEEAEPHLPPALASDPETERYRLFDAVTAWLSATAADQPVLLVLDDLQWATKPTVLLLRHVARAAESARLLIVAIYRDTDLTHDHPLVELIGDLRREQRGGRLPLVGLDDRAVTDFLEQVAGHELDEAGVTLAHAIHRETEGNPFFVWEVLRHLVETGAVERRAEGWDARRALDEVGIPEGVREVVGRRLTRLSKDANRVLRAAAVIGAEFELDVLALTEVAHDEEDLLAALEEACGARLLVEVPGPTPRFRFAHALVHDTLYQDLPAARRATLHRRVAEAIEAAHGPRGLDEFLPALAHHWVRAGVPLAETQRAVAYTIRAGERALAILAHDEAAAYFHQALDLLDATRADEAQRLEVLILLGEAQQRAGDPDYRETLLEASRLARLLGNAPAAARAALGNSRGWSASSLGRVDRDRVEVLEGALELVPGGDSPVRARLLAGLAEELFYTGDRARVEALSDQALAMARRCGDPPTLVYALLRRFFSIIGPGTLPERRRNVMELLSLVDHVDDPVITLRVLSLQYRTAMEEGNVAEADACVTRYEELARDVRQPVLAWVAGLNRSMRVLIEGDLDEAERLVMANAAAASATGQPDAPVFVAGQMFSVRTEQDRLAEVEPIMKRGLSVTTLPVLQAALTVIYCETGRIDEARRQLELVAPDGFAALAEDNMWLLTMLLASRAVRALGDRARASEIAPLLAPYANQFSFTSAVTLGAVALHLGMLTAMVGRYDESERHFANADRMHRRIPSPTFTSRTQLEWARMLLARRASGDEERAWRFVGEALATTEMFHLAAVRRALFELVADEVRISRDGARPALPPDQLVATGDWLLARHDVDTALVCFAASTAWDRLAAALVSHPALSTRPGDVAEHLAVVPDPVRRGDPRLCFVSAYVSNFAGDNAEAVAWRAAGRACERRGDLLDGTHDWEMLETVLRASAGYNDLGGAILAGSRALDILPATSRYRLVVHWLLGCWRCFEGDYNGALGHLEVAAKEPAEGSDDVYRLVIAAYRALAFFGLRQPERAATFVTEAAHLRSNGAGGPWALSAVVVEARSATEQGRPRPALELCRDGLRDGQRWADSHLIVPCLHIEQARAHVTLGSYGAAAASLDEAYRLLAGLADAGAVPGWADEVRAVLPGEFGRSRSVGQTALPAPLQPLSSRELEVLRLLGGSMSLRDIANELYVSLNTLKSHCRSVYRKLGAASREEAVRRAREAGLAP